MRYLPVKFHGLVADCPNFHRSGSIRGMRKQFYGANATLVRCGQWIYNISGSPMFNEVINKSKPT